MIFRIWAMIRIFFVSSFYSKDCFSRSVILFNSRICVCQCPTGVNCPRKSMGNSDLYIHIYIYIYIYIQICTVCKHTFVYMQLQKHINTSIYIFSELLFFLSFSFSLRLICENVFDFTDLFKDSLCVYMFAFVSE